MLRKISKYQLNRGYQQAQRSNTKMAVALRANAILEPKDQKKIPVLNAVITEADLRKDDSEKRVRFIAIFIMLISF